MDKNSVIAIRDALLNDGKNRSVRIVFDNGVNLSYSSDIIIWDDDTEVVVGFTACADGGSYSANLPIQIICSTYENIQFIMGNVRVDEIKEGYDLKSMIESLSDVVSIADEEKADIIEWYSKLYSHKYELSRENYDPVDIIRGKKGMTKKEEVKE